MGGADIEIRVTPAKRTISVDLGPKSSHLSSPESYFEGLSAAKWNAQYFHRRDTEFAEVGVSIDQELFSRRPRGRENQATKFSLLRPGSRTRIAGEQTQTRICIREPMG